MMTVGELLEVLEDLDPDRPVMIAHQPSWPIAEMLSGCVPGDELEDVDEDGELVDDEGDDDQVVWLVAGGHDPARSPYAPSRVFES